MARTLGGSIFDKRNPAWLTQAGSDHRGGAELELPSWTAIQKADLLSRWAFNQMLIGVATRKYARSVRLPDGDLAGQAKRATTKSSVSRRFVALSTAKLKEWLATDLSGLDLLLIRRRARRASGCPSRQ